MDWPTIISLDHGTTTLLVITAVRHYFAVLLIQLSYGQMVDHSLLLQSSLILLPVGASCLKFHPLGIHKATAKPSPL